MAAGLFIFIFFNYLLRFDGPSLGYWDTYITEPALFIANQHVEFVSKDGQKLYSYTLTGKLPENLVNTKTYGISSKDQRLGGAIIFSPWFTFFNIFGFRLLFAVSGTLIAVFVFLTARMLFKRFSIAFFASGIAALNSYILSINNLNPNILGMMLASILIYLLIEERPNTLIIGLLYGALGGIRNEAILFLPAIIYLLSISSNKKAKDITLFFFGSLITIAPILYWNHYAFGNPFMHPTQSPRLEGFRPVFMHKFLLWKFNFNGMLNFPFYSKIIRTPYFSFPTFLSLPLVLISSFGVILSVFIISGMLSMLKKQKKLFIFLIVWFLPMYLLLSVQENWSNLKMTFLLMCFNPLIVFMAAGLNSLLLSKRPINHLTKVISLSFILFITVRLLFYSDFDVDQRWYERFPRAVKGLNISYIGDDLRTKKEDPAEILTQKKYLTRGSVLPRLSGYKIEVTAKLAVIKQEINQKDITIVDYWKYIYEK